MERMTKENKIHLEGAKVYGPQDYEVVDELKKLKEENKKLNIKVASLEGEIKGLNSVIEKLKEENQTLELWLDNKEKVNKSLREENKKLKDDLDRIEEIKDKEWIKLLNENERLSKELEKKEKSLRAWRKLKK